MELGLARCLSSGVLMRPLLELIGLPDIWARPDRGTYRAASRKRQAASADREGDVSVSYQA